MLDLQSPRWMELEHAYGCASDIPGLLEGLRSLPRSFREEEPWFSLCSALAHQGDVYSATFAAVPHVIAALATDPGRACSTLYHFPAWVEICRVKKGVEVPSDLSEWYFDALARLPGLVAQAATREWDMEFAQSALSAIAAAKGQHELAELLFELYSPADIVDFREWQYSRHQAGLN